LKRHHRRAKTTCSSAKSVILQNRQKMHPWYVYGNPILKVKITILQFFTYPQFTSFGNCLLDMLFNADSISGMTFSIKLILFEFGHLQLFDTFYPFLTSFLAINLTRTGRTYEFINDKVTKYFLTLYTMLQTVFIYLLYF